MQHEFTELRLIAEWPADIPESALIFNAARPLEASQLEGRWLEWQGDFRHGIFYVAVLPDDPDRERKVKNNLSLDAWLVGYMSEARAKLLVKLHTMKFLRTRPNIQLPGGLTLAEYVDRNWQEVYPVHCARRPVLVDPVHFTVIPTE